MQIKLIFMWMKIDFAYEKMSSKTRFVKEAWGNSEMAHLSKSVSTEQQHQNLPIYIFLNSVLIGRAVVKRDIGWT